MGNNMYPAASLLGQDKDESIVAMPVDDLIEKADGFAGVFPGMILFSREIDNYHSSSSFFSRYIFY